MKRNVRVSGKVAYVINPPGSLGIAATYARGVTSSAVGVAAEAKGNVYVLSLRGGFEADRP